MAKVNLKKDQIPFTAEGLEKLNAELDELKKVKRPQKVERLAETRAPGDLDDNQEYQQAREELSMLDGRIEELENVVSRAVVFKKEDNGGVVGLGSSVTVETKGKESVFRLVGEWEADPTLRKVSYKSPLGRMLLGKKPGEKVEVEAPVGKLIYKVVEVK